MNTQRAVLCASTAVVLMFSPRAALRAQTDPAPPKKTTSVKPGGGLGDGITAEKVRHNLITDRRIDPSGVKVASSSGKVALSGTVANTKARTFAQEDAQKAPGVKRVVNRLKIAP